MGLTQLALVYAVGLFVGMLVLFEAGRRIGKRNLMRDPDGLAKGVGAAEGAVFGLLGLIIAFTFAGAGGRFEERRDLVTHEVNAIGTAYLRLDLLGAEAQPALRKLFRTYTELRAGQDLDTGNLEAISEWNADSARVQGRIWSAALAASRAPDAAPQAVMLLMPALNDMIDITTTRAMAVQNHPPGVIFLLLAGLSLIGSLLVGYAVSGNRHRSWLHTTAFAGIMSLCLYVILDLEYPRAGLINMKSADRMLVELSNTMK